MKPKKCSIHDCEREVIARGLCDLHYRRLLHHGDVQRGRPVDWGKREDHPLYGMWTWQRRNGELMEEVWRDDFWQFVKDVGDRPSKSHKVFRLFPDQPIGPNNFFWREIIFAKKKTEEEKEYRARYAREYRKLRPEQHKHYDLKRHFGITADDYAKILESQSGMCAICGTANERVIDKKTGKLRMLAVDHCHKTGKIRGLLCQYCNQGLGNFRDSIKFLTNAISYLEKHS